MRETRQLASWTIRLRLIWAQAMLLIENIWSASSLLFVALTIFLILSFFGVWEFLPPYLHAPLLLAVLGGVFYGFYRLVRDFKYPDQQDVFTAVETRNHLVHRPLHDLAAADAAHMADGPRSEALWRLHIARQQQRLSDISFIAPRLWLSMGDPHGLRAMSLLGLILSVPFANATYEERLQSAFNLSFGGAARVISVDIWTSPPDYTGEAPKLLYQGNGEGITQPVQAELPEGSRLVANVSGLEAEDQVLMRSGERDVPLTSAGGGNFQGEFDNISKGQWQLIGDGDVLAEFNFFVRPDLPPVVNLLALPFATSRSALQILGRAEDDYGVKTLQARFRRDGMSREVRIALPFPEGEKAAESQSYNDLTADLWAGLPVKLLLEATDMKGQIGTSREVEIMLPERRFTHPVARVLVEERKKIASDPRNHRLPVIATLDAISSLPDALDFNWGVILSISVARSMLIDDVRFEKIEEVADLLWQSALRLENGNLSVAEQSLRDAEKALMDALNRGADDAEISELVQNLKEAMNRFLQELAEKSLTEEDMQKMSEMGGANVLAQEDLNKLLNQLDDLAKSGARSAARDLLNELQNILEHLQSAGNMGMSPQMQSGQKMLRGLDQIMNQQQRLMDESFSMSEREARDAARQAADPNALPDLQRGGQYGKLREQQEALRRQLGEMMGEIGTDGEIPAPFGRAERAMNAAREALANQQAAEAQRWQQQALEQLQQSAAGLAQQMMQGQGSGTMRGAQQGRGSEDPLGRGDSGKRMGGRGEDQIPGTSSVSRARAVMNELRRRLNDPDRSDIEKEYLRRLMQRFN